MRKYLGIFSPQFRNSRWKMEFLGQMLFGIQASRDVFRLHPANAMSTDGEFFCHESLWDKKTGLFYHKEQFRDSVSALPAEYLVVDRRFTVSEIEKWIEDVGLTVVLRRFVRAGFAADFTPTTGKEILIIARRRRED